MALMFTFRTTAKSVRSLKANLLRSKKSRKSVISQIRIFRSGKRNLSKTTCFWPRKYKAHVIYWRRKHKPSKIMKMAPQGGKGFVLFVTLRGTTRANAAMAHVEGLPSAITVINILKWKQRFRISRKSWKNWRKSKKNQKINLTHSSRHEKERRVVFSQ